MAKTIIDELTRQYSNGWQSLASLRLEWREKEAILLGKTLDQKTTEGKSKVFDPRLSTYIFERASRVMAQNPTGSVQVFSKKDAGKNLILNALLKNFVIPNANSQFDFLTKTRLWDVYSNVYGSFGVLVDWVVKDDYIGPDFQLIPMRNIVFQSGVQSFNDSDFVFVVSFVSKRWLETRDKKTWKNIDKVLEKAKSKEKEEKSFTEEKYDNPVFGRDEPRIEIITKYEHDRWTTFSRDAKVVLRDIENPQKNGKLPVVLKHCFPLLDRVIGLGEIERTKSLQYAINSLINLYLDGVKMSIFPPLLINPTGVVMRSLEYGAAKKWFVKQAGAIQQLPLSPQGTNTFQSTYAFLNAAILNAFGTSDVATTAGTDPALGKTPEALKLMSLRESARDNWDRFMMERALEEVLDRFVDLLTKRQEKPIKVYLAKEELDAIAKIHPDVVEMFQSGKYGQLIVKPSETKNLNCRFFIDAGSTLKKDELVENQNLTSILSLVLKLPGAIEQISQTGKVKLGNLVIDFGELFKRWMITSGTKDWDKIVSVEEVQKGENPVNFESPEMKEVLSQLSPELQQVFASYGQKGQAGVPQTNTGIGQPASELPVAGGVQGY